MLKEMLGGWMTVMGILYSNSGPSMIRPLGCYMPFDLNGTTSSWITSIDGRLSCPSCNISADFVLIRGLQCVCLTSEQVSSLTRIRDKYCDIRCNGEFNGVSKLFCGGNLGGNLYCDAHSRTCTEIVVDQSEPLLNIYLKHDLDSIIQQAEVCGRPDDGKVLREEYFPSLNPKDCIIYCSQRKTTYAHIGWKKVSSDNTTTVIPTCVCSNVTQMFEKNDTTCRETCPESIEESCGSKTLDSWVVYCTRDDSQCLNDNIVVKTTAKPQFLDDDQPVCDCAISSNKKALMRGGDNTGSEDGYIPNCDHGPCATSQCYFKENDSCYQIENAYLSKSVNVSDTIELRNYAIGVCATWPGHLLAIETEEEKNFITETLFKEDPFCYLTSGIKKSGSNVLYWDLNNSEIQFNKDQVESEWGIQFEDECNDYGTDGINPISEDDQYLFLAYNLSSKEYNIWHFTNYIGEGAKFICEFPAPPANTTTSTEDISSTTESSTETTIEPSTSSSTSSSTSQSTSTTTSTTITSTKRSPTLTSPTTSLPPKREDGQCPCIATDLYNDLWIISANKTRVRTCREGAFGFKSWSCDHITRSNKCQFRTNQPYFEDCQSKELANISANINSNETEVTDVWKSLRDFTAPPDKYFGHEITEILDLVTNLLNRQDSEMNYGFLDNVQFQINSTKYGAEIIDNLISHYFQWDQLSNDSRSIIAIKLLEVAEDVAYRLANVAHIEKQSLRCETHFPNVSISSSYWDGSDQKIEDCTLEDDNFYSSDVFVRFPASILDRNCSTHLLLPNSYFADGKPHKSAGVLVSASAMVNHLLPGANNKPAKLKKIVNSPLISYTLYDVESTQMDRKLTKSHLLNDNNTFYVQLTYEHEAIATNPPVRTVRRSLEPGEEPSVVIGSSYCVYLLLDDESKSKLKEAWSENNSLQWTWDDWGCQLVSTNKTHTVCQCNHLTGFANLMDFHDYLGRSVGLDITSITCGTLSIICLLITFIILLILRSIKTDRTVITQNLCVSLIVSNFLILTTLDKHFLHLDDITCAMMGILLHFSLLSSFMWMGIEGLRLCRMVIYVFNLSDWTMYYVMAAYTVPLLIVGITVLTANFTDGILVAYVGDETCWLIGEGYMWSFAGPVAVVTLANVVFVSVAIHSSWNLKQNLERSMPEKIGNAAAMALSLTCLLGLSWLLGFLMYAETIVFAYMFTIVNGLQGVAIFLFRCLLNDEVRTNLFDRWKRHRKNRMGRWSSNVTNMTNSQRRQSSPEETSTNNKIPRAAPSTIINSKLRPFTSQMSVASNSTGSAEDWTSSTSLYDSPQRSKHHKDVVRTFSGTEFADENSSEVYGSMSSLDSAAVTRSRRVSFATTKSSIPEESSSALYY